MKIRYDKDADAIYIKFRDGEYEVSKEVDEDVILDFDKKDKLIGIEILDVSEKIPAKNFMDVTFGVSR